MLRVFVATWWCTVYLVGLRGVNGQMGDDEQVLSDHHDGYHDLAWYPGTIRHTFACANTGIWKNSCDIDLSMKTKDVTKMPTVFTPANWSTACDPWKGVTELGTLAYKDGVWKDKDGVTQTGWGSSKWTCPVSQRSVSGCGDFRTDTRQIKCSIKELQTLSSCGRPGNGDRRVYRQTEIPVMAGPQRHVCIQHPIFYDNHITGGPVLPPALGRHRERWAKWGEYEWIPPQRWVHNAEHGGIIFLYHPCLDKKSICTLRRFIQKWQKRIPEIKWKSGGKDLTDSFRFILTPFKDLKNPMAMVAWGYVYTSKCFNSADMDDFVISHYRNSIEDWPPAGAYNHLWKDIATTADGCPALPPADHPRLVPQLKVDADKETAELRALIGELKGKVDSMSQTISNLKKECVVTDDRRFLGEEEKPCYALTSGASPVATALMVVVAAIVALQF